MMEHYQSSGFTVGEAHEVLKSIDETKSIYVLGYDNKWVKGCLLEKVENIGAYIALANNEWKPSHYLTTIGYFIYEQLSQCSFDAKLVTGCVSTNLVDYIRSIRVEDEGVYLECFSIADMHK